MRLFFSSIAFFSFMVSFSCVFTLYKITTEYYTVQAAVIDYQIKKSPAHSYFPKVKYSVEDRVYTILSKSSSNTKYSIGEPVTLYYFKDDPSTFFLAYDIDRQWFILGVFFCVFMVFHYGSFLYNAAIK